MLVCLLAAGGCDDPSSRGKAPLPSVLDAAQARSVELGPRFERTQTVGEGEEVSILLLPDQDSDLLDQRCLIYKNAKIGAVAVHCPSDFDAPHYDGGDDQPDCPGGRYGAC